MRFKLEISCDNAAFDEEPSIELARILHLAANQLEEGTTDDNLRDSNGNTVGHFELIEINNHKDQ